MNTGMPAAYLGVVVEAKGVGRTNAQLMRTHGVLTGVGGAATRMGKQFLTGLKYLSLGALAGVAAAGKLAISFDKEMRNVNSIAQLGERAFGKLQNRVLALAGPTAQAPKTLAAGLYDLVSSGFDSSESLHILEKSARAATAGLTTTEVSTAAVAAVLNAYQLGAGKAGDVSDVLFRIVDRGVIKFEELSHNIGDVLPFAASLEINLREVGASIATMTKAGINPAETMTRIKAVMVTLLKPSKALNEAIREQGYESGEAMIKALGFQGTLDALAKSTGGSKEAMGALFPNIRAMGGALALTGDNSKVAAGDLRSMEEASGATSRALSQQSKSIAFQWQQLKATAEALAIKFGMKLLPELSKVMKIITDPNLTVDQKVGKVFDIIAEGAQGALSTATDLASTYAPRFVKALASGLTSAWVDMNPLGKLLTAAALIRLMGGRGAITAAGAAVGRWLGGGIATGTTQAVVAGAGATTIASAAVGGSPAAAAVGAGAAWNPAAPALGAGAGRQAAATATSRAMLAEAFGGFTLAAAASAGTDKAAKSSIFRRATARMGQSAAARYAASFGGAAAGLLGRVPWARAGGLGLGIWAADETIKEFGRRTDERSDDLKTALESVGKRGFLAETASLASPYGNEGRRDERGMAENLLAQYEEMAKGKVRISEATERSLRSQAAELDLTKAQSDQLRQMFDVMRLGRGLDVEVDLGMDPKKLAAIGNGFDLLRSGLLTSLRDIQTVTQRTSANIASTLGTKSKDGRDKLAENYRSAAVAIGKAMNSGDISVKQGLARMKELFRNADLISGDDPLGIAKGFAASWRKAGGINAQQRKDMIADLGKMPPAAREKAYDAMVKYGQGLVKGGKIPKQDLRDFRSAALATFTDLKVKSVQSAGELAVGIANNFGTMGTAVGGVLEIILKNTNGTLGAFGADPVKYTINAVNGGLGALADFAGTGKKAQEKQGGGFIVPGSGSGDTFHTALPPGSFIENREAVAALPHPMQTGGVTPVALEPGERVYLPREVQTYGQRHLEARNSAVPRFQKGGMHGKPQIAGPAGPLLDIAQSATDKAWDASRDFIQKQRPKTSTAGGGNFGGASGRYPGVSGDTDFTPALGMALSKMARATGTSISVTSGWRSYAEQAALYRLYQEGRGNLAAPPGSSNHEDGRAADISPGRETFGGVAGRYGLGFTVPSESWHIELLQLGGLVQKLAKGGSVAEWDALVGGSSGWDNNELATLAHLVRMQNPGYMAQIAQGESSGDRKALGNDAAAGYGNTWGLGLWQITTGVGNEAIISKWGGKDAMFHPYFNARAAKEIQEGNPGAWFAPPTGPKGQVQPDLAARMQAVVGGKGAGAQGLTEGQKKTAEGKRRKANYEQRLQTLTQEANQAKSLPAQQSKLWKLMKFWGRVGIFDKDERSHILDAVQNAASQTKPQGAVNVLRRLAGYAKNHGEITGRDPSNFRSMEKAIERAQGRGREQRQKTVERQKKHVEGVRKRVEAKIANRAAFPQWVDRLTNLRHGADAGEEFASQLVALEPENVTDAYVAQERGAYGNQLTQLLGWRNSTINAQEYASAEIGRFEQQIAAIEELNIGVEQGVAVKAGGKGKLLGGLVEQFAAGGKTGKGKAGSGAGKGVPSNTYAQYKKAAYKIPLLEQAIADAKTMRDETWAGELEEIQGLSGPRGILDSLPSEPVAGAFGGRIFEIQNSIRELALKVSDVTADNTQLKELEAQLNTDWKKRFLVSEAQRNTIGSFESVYGGGRFAGAFAKGGTIPAGQWGIAGETGEAEIVHGPARVYSPAESEALMGGGGPLVIEELHVHEDGRVSARMSERDLELLVQKVIRDGRVTGRPTSGGAR